MAKGIKTGGREAGTPNRLTSELRSVLKEIIYDEMQRLPDALADLPIKDRLDILIKLCNFVLPKVEKVKATAGEPITKEWWEL
ncbi:hypothetical protein BA6E_121380 [Bacteroidales bacterium 6E]|nr:hypothetical protein BA6E_121380 [Bacteroidales bacterium 6E]